MEEDLVFLRDNSLSLETINDFRIILFRQRKLVLTLFGKEGSSPESEEVKVFYEKSDIQEKIAGILLSSSFNGDDFSDIKLEAAIILAALTRFVVSSRERLDAVARELIIALRAISENELLCEDFAGSMEVVFSLVKKEKLHDILMAMKESDLPSPLNAWLVKTLELLEDLDLK
eukprot:gene6539-7040_t